ncbi:MAG: helix-turn-helix transcriptional regulator [Polyangiales bacterium]
MEPHSDGNTWTFLSNHALVLITVAADHDIRVREIAHEVGITERAVQRILRELANAGALVWERVGRRNHYRVCPDSPLRHPIESHRCVADLLRLSRLARAPSEAVEDSETEAAWSAE